MGQIVTLVIGIFLISCQFHSSTALDPISIASTALKFGKSIYDISKMLFEDDKSTNEVAVLIKNLNQDIQSDMTQITDILKDLPSIIQLAQKKETLQGHFAIIGQVFEEASRMKKDINDGIVERNNTKYHRFAQKEKDIDHSIYEIRRILTDTDTTLVLRQKFNELSKKFDNVCKTGLSHLQLLDSLLSNLKAATLQYYMSKNLMYEFLELIGEDNTSAKETLLKHVNLDYSNAVEKFKEVMSTASVELWKCDPDSGYNDVLRYNNTLDPNFAELRIFSKYILNEDNFVSEASPCPDKKCNSITKLEKCGTSDSHFCRKVRLCPGKLLNCQQFTFDDYPLPHVKICMNKDASAYHRFYSIVRKGEPKENFQCEEKGTKRHIYSTPFISPHNSAPSCHYCSCFCEEAEYFLDNQLVLSDIDRNKVATGARFVVEKNTLRLQLQQAILLENGIIDKSTLEWIPLKPIDEMVLTKISFEEYKKFALAPVKASEDWVVTSIGLDIEPAIKTIILRLGTNELDFKTGKLKHKKFFYNDVKYIFGSVPTQKYNMTGRDVSTKSKKENKPNSTDEQYVELSVSDLAKDGGQSVVPFIDTQSVTANGPLSGASLYIRGQSNFGGFLAIKLYTYDVRKYVNSERD